MNKTDSPLLYNSRLIEIYVRLIKRKYSYINISDLLSYADIERSHVEDPGHWFTQEQVDRFNEQLAKLTGNKDISREAGRYAASPEAAGILKQYLLGLAGPAKAFEMFAKSASKLTKSSTYESRRLASNKVELIVRPVEGVQEKKFQCENRMGLMEATTMLFNNRLPLIDHPECCFKGDEVCRYIVSWKESQSVRYMKIRNVSAFFLSAFCGASLYIDPYSTMTMVLPFSLSIVMVLSWHAASLESKELNSAIDNLRNASEHLLDRINENYSNALMVNEIGQALSKQIEVDDLLEKIVQTLEKRLDFDRAMILLANKEQTRLIFRAGFGYTADQLSVLNHTEFRLDNPESVGALVISFRDQKPLLISNIDEIRGSLSSHSFEFAKKMGVKSFIACPIIFEDESIGVMAVDNVSEKRPLGQSDMNLLMGIVPGIGISIHNAMLVEAELQQFKSVIQVLAASIDARDPLTAGHSIKVSEYVLGTCYELGLSREYTEMMEIAALLHDYGKIGIEDSILKKDGQLTMEEYEIIKTHAEKTENILERMNFKGTFKEVPLIAAAHHEKIDGTGYPRGLKDEDIPLGAKIIAVADFFEAITSERHYRNPMPLEMAFDLLNRNCGKAFDKDVVSAFLSYFNRSLSGRGANVETEADRQRSLENTPLSARVFKRVIMEKECVIEPMGSFISTVDRIEAKTTDYSTGGLGLKYEGVEIPKGTMLRANLEEMDILQKVAQVVWTAAIGQNLFRIGLQWI